jgi:hypothetical protein
VEGNFPIQAMQTGAEETIGKIHIPGQQGDKDILEVESGIRQKIRILKLEIITANHNQKNSPKSQVR